MTTTWREKPPIRREKLLTRYTGGKTMKVRIGLNWTDYEMVMPWTHLYGGKPDDQETFRTVGIRDNTPVEIEIDGWMLAVIPLVAAPASAEEAAATN